MAPTPTVLMTQTRGGHREAGFWGGEAGVFRPRRDLGIPAS